MGTNRRSLSLMLAAAALVWGTAADAAGVKVAPYGVTKDGQAVNAYTLVNDKGASATILDYGGAIAEIRVPDRQGLLGNVVMSFADLAAWETVGHANANVGRYANRIRKGFTLDGVQYPLQQNAQGVTLHGGQPPYTTRVWKAEPIRESMGAMLTLTLDSPDGDQGFPGNLKIRATYRFTNDNALRLGFEAVSDKPTVVNLTNHLYFNLNGDSTTPVYDHDLQVMADRVQAKDADNLPTGELLAVTGTPFDLTKPTVLSTRVAAAHDTSPPPQGGQPPPTPDGMVRSYDHAFAIMPGYNRLDRVAARLHDPASGRVLELSTSQTSIQVFTPGARNGVMSEVGKPFARGPAVALETQHLPDSPNHADFPSTVLRPGQTYRQTTVFAFRTDR